MNNQQWNNKLLHFYDTLNAHDDINISYANLLDTLYVEMDTQLKVRGKGKRGRQQYKGAYYYNKPYWTKELSEQWRKMKSAEHLFIKKTGTKQENLQLRSAFQSQQWKFDKTM